MPETWQDLLDTVGLQYGPVQQIDNYFNLEAWMQIVFSYVFLCNLSSLVPILQSGTALEATSSSAELCLARRVG